MIPGAAVVEIAPWPKPDVSVLMDRRDAPALPMECFGRWAPWLETAAECASAPVDYVAGSLLAAAAGCIGNARVALPWSGWIAPSVIWIGLVGDPSDRKSPGMNEIGRALAEVEKSLGVGLERLEHEWQEKTEIAKAVRGAWQDNLRKAARDGTTPPSMPEAAILPEPPARPRIVVRDTSSEALGSVAKANAKGLLMVRDELAGWLGSFDRYTGAGADRALWIEAYDAKPYTIDRVKHDKPIRIDRLALSVLGGIQPDVLTTRLLKGDDDGLAARFLWLWPAPRGFAQPRGDLDPAILVEALHKLARLDLDVAEDGSQRPRLIRLSNEATRCFVRWHREHDQEFTAGKLKSAFGKLPGYALRIALVLAYLDFAIGGPEPSEIDETTLLRALAFIDDYAKPMLRRVYGDAARPESERNAATLARWIVATRPERINARDLYRTTRLPGLAKAEQVHAAINELVEAGWVREALSRAPTAPGRNKGDCEINPACYEAGI